ncbi:MAG: DUF5018 domain-containing protein [bacterium]|nr:DUF5018 domain-containing protein [bacterium]
MLCVVSCFISCYNIIGDGAKSSACEIISFSVSSQLGNTIINPRDLTVAVTTGSECNLERVKPLIDISPKAQISPASGMETDFSSGAVPYTVTAKNGTQQVWEVSVARGAAAGTEIKDFAFYTAYNNTLITDVSGVIDEESRAITVKLPYDSAVSGLVAVFSSTGASLSVNGVTQLSGETAVDFNEPVTYRVRAHNNTTRDYTVTVENGCACPERIRRGHYDIETQDDVAALAGYTAITGTLIIEENHSSNITSLKELACLTEIGGGLQIRNTGGLVTLEGLNHLVSVDACLLLNGNAGLENLEALNSLKTIGRQFEIVGNRLLTDLKGLENLVAVGERLFINSNASLKSPEGLSGLVSIGTDLYIDNNQALVRLLDPGLGSLDFVGEEFKFTKNRNLCTDLVEDLGVRVTAGSVTISGNKVCE